jgi:hypothetical protein
MVQFTWLHLCANSLMFEVTAHASLAISQENLDALPEAGIPCGVDWKQTEEGASNLVPEATSVDNSGDVDEGTASGPCSFAVAGLTGE